MRLCNTVSLYCRNEKTAQKGGLILYFDVQKYFISKFKIDLKSDILYIER